jgi:hypothetical protein
MLWYPGMPWSSSSGHSERAVQPTAQSLTDTPVDEDSFDGLPANHDRDAIGESAVPTSASLALK